MKCLREGEASGSQHDWKGKAEKSTLQEESGEVDKCHLLEPLRKTIFSGPWPTHRGLPFSQAPVTGPVTGSYRYRVVAPA